MPRCGPRDLRPTGVRRWLAGHPLYPFLLGLAEEGLRMGHIGPLPQGRYDNRVPDELVDEVTTQIAREAALGWLREVPPHVPTAGNAPVMAKQEPWKVRRLQDFSNRHELPCV